MPDNILFSKDPASDLNKFLAEKKYSKILVLTDTNTAKHCYPVINTIPSHSTFVIESGEAHKNLVSCENIWMKMTEQHLDRHSVLIVLGGGVLGDMGGFCAATYKRGIDFILVPTTLLSQVDASIGGKLGIDFHHFKNHIGVFQTPALTLLYSGFLKTLPEHEVRSGFAEVIKHTLISDENMWQHVKTSDLEHQNWDVLIKHSVDFKAKVVQEDPKEKGLRKILNAGHTIGHAIETYFLTNNRTIMHGEAVAAGLIAEGFIAVERNLLSKASLTEINNYIIKVFGKLQFSALEEKQIAELTTQDKKNKGNKILSVLLTGIGKANWDYEITLSEVERALSFYRTL
ncbi:3-dehydroquinate synthase [Chryseosolibacter indicus]|uniref:3-dehydroquinate synthase n=1 Tax=Chryseosolibacter indicus TaxID=2782351 RepID=A0ABS5VM88_9BACT|nr:3-dehydroquinate synthase [Chryseosolibacter indicus]MBT1702128.1 3-dehydroquinate synthase [Chryseosolibacter indicus]